MKAKILVVDDHEAARSGITLLLVDHGFQVIGVAENGRAAIAAVQSQQTDAVVMDVHMPKIDGLAAIEGIRSNNHDLPIVVVSAYENPTYIARAATLGAYDYVLKNGHSNTICESLSRAVSGQSPPTGSRLVKIREKLSEFVDPLRMPVDFPLTGREAQVLVHVALGLSNKEIAQSLNISVETVKEHVQNIIRKIKAKDRTDAAVRAVRLGLVD